MRLRRLPEALSSPPTLTDHVPRFRRQVEQRLGPDGADLLFAVVNSAAAALTVSPASAAAEAATRAMLAAEAWNGRMAWRNTNPNLPHTLKATPDRRHRVPAGRSAERYADRAGAAGLARRRRSGCCPQRRTAAAAAIGRRPQTHPRHS